MLIYMSQLRRRYLLAYVETSFCWIGYRVGDFLEIVGLSISVSLTATATATAVSLPLGAGLAVFPFRWRHLVVVLINAFFGLPPVVVGLALYLALSRSGALGSLALLFTPTAMVMAQSVLAIPENFRARVEEVSKLLDSTNPDLSAFFAHGGKLIMRENLADLAQSPLAGINYFQSVVAKLGQTTVDASARLYLSPGSTHTGNGATVPDGTAIPTMVDLLDPLDHWAADGIAPADALIQTVKETTPPFALKASRPMCRYPDYPHYVGANRSVAESYDCRETAP
ncbi:ABC transporter permease [Bradyrhizobium sp. AUGA SZCCT0051]|nr:ABC transporter permease [Bradyrhizobium sp. AUGA SZCCT0124]MBR1317086.1 ABC transporter permease [Bradyrhizobium sp. AUGA SZCCT0051]MBR1345598.1 ABC transporter permease [Bradyrhizobium sp. AUGA SZCCT0105]MBR1360332.1 ABC transporter permease [Bradyrhizobium sp. AUGA SZCCT0045]